MLALRELQQAFSAAMLEHEEDGIHSAISAEGVAPDMRLRIYRNNILSSLIGGLQALFPAIDRLVGEDFFKAAAREFILADPPGSGRLGEYGRSFPAFLESFPPAATLPYLGDVARVELAWYKAYRAAEATPLDTEALGRLTPEEMARLTLTLHPSASLLKTAHPAGRIWQATLAEPDSDDRVDVGKGADHLLAIRPDAEVEIRMLSPPTFTFLEALQSGSTLVEAFETAAGTDAEFDLQQNLADFIGSGTFTAFDLAPTSWAPTSWAPTSGEPT